MSSRQQTAVRGTVNHQLSRESIIFEMVGDWSGRKNISLLKCLGDVYSQSITFKVYAYSQVLLSFEWLAQISLKNWEVGQVNVHSHVL